MMTLPASHNHHHYQPNRACMTLVADRLDGKVLLRVLGKLLTLIRVLGGWGILGGWPSRPLGYLLPASSP